MHNARPSSDLAHAVWQVSDQRIAVALQAKEGDHLLNLLTVMQFRAPHAGKKGELGDDTDSGMAVAADQQVLQQRGLREQLDVLEGARDPQPGNAVRRDVGDLPVFQEQPP